MPLIQDSDYRRPFWLVNAHWETVIPALLRNPQQLDYERERIATRDDDFLDLDFVYNDSDRLVILSHGLEGDSDRYYMRSMAVHFLQHGWDTLSWNCRSCSSEINTKAKLYHHGATDDLEDVINHALTKSYKDIILIGFSLGGSLVVKYLGENGNTIPAEIRGGIVYSIPCQLGSCAKKLSAPENKLYLNRFLQKLKEKIRVKAQQYPGWLDLEGLEQIDNFYEFDSKYSAPINGFQSAEAFYDYASAGNYIEGISVPTLLANAKNDPMLADDCYPVKEAKGHKYFYLETPERGGHLGFWWPGVRTSWLERRAMQFTSEIIGLNGRIRNF